MSVIQFIYDYGINIAIFAQIIFISGLFIYLSSGSNDAQTSSDKKED